MLSLRVGVGIVKAISNSIRNKNRTTEKYRTVCEEYPGQNSFRALLTALNAHFSILPVCNRGSALLREKYDNELEQTLTHPPPPAPPHHIQTPPCLWWREQDKTFVSATRPSFEVYGEKGQVVLKHISESKRKCFVLRLYAKRKKGKKKAQDSLIP